MQPLTLLADKYGIDRRGLKSLADSGLIPTIRVDNVKHGPTLMSDAALAPLIHRMRTLISGTLAAPMIGVHQMYLEELEQRGLVERVEGTVLRPMKSETYYTRASVEDLKERISKQVKRGPPRDSLRLRVALRALNVRSVPWPGIVQAIADGRLEVFSLKPRGLLGERLAIGDAKVLGAIFDKELARKQILSPKWVGNAAVAEILGVNEVVVWRLTKAGKLKRHTQAPLYSPFKRCEVDRLAHEAIFTPEIVRTGSFQTYREASTWLKNEGIAARLELKNAGWKLYSRVEVEMALKRRAKALPPKPRRTVPARPKGLLHGPESPEEKLAVARESLGRSRVGFATAASILGCTIFAVQKLATNGKLDMTREVTPFNRAQVEALAKQIVFLPEIMRRSRYVSYRGVMNWLKNAGIKPLFWLKVRGVPVFDRHAVEGRIADPLFVGGSHPRVVKRKLLDMVEGGSSVHQASIACGISYATAKTWVRNERPA
jgi:hypothetical protein